MAKEQTKTVLACELCNGNCWGCFYSDNCGNWNDTDPSDIPTVTVKTGTEITK